MCPYPDISESSGHICRTIELYYEYSWMDEADIYEWKNYTYGKALKEGHYDKPNTRITCCYNYYGSLTYRCYESGEYTRKIERLYDKSLDAIKEIHNETNSRHFANGFNGEIISYFQHGKEVKSVTKGTLGNGSSMERVYETEEYVRNEDGSLQKTITRDKRGNLIGESIWRGDSVIHYEYSDGENISSNTHSLSATSDDEIISEYTYDEYGNWVTCTKKKDGKVIETGVRIITYYNDYYVYKEIDPDKYNIMVDSALIAY